MKLHRFALTVFALVLGLFALVLVLIAPIAARAHGEPAAPAQYGYGQNQGGWDTPPQELSDVQRQGFHDGIEGARRDLQNHRRPDPNNRDEYRHPGVPRPMWDAYRDGFRRGYSRGIQYLTNPQPMQQPVPVQPPPPPRGDMDMPNGPAADVMHRGFQEGMEGALRDLENNRRPDPNNRDEFRHPNAPYGLQDAYRDGFRHGYDRGIDLLTNGPERGDDFMRRAFSDGVEGALKDLGNNRQPDPNNRDEFRSPNVPYDRVQMYQDGFRHGYERAWQELIGYRDHR